MPRSYSQDLRDRVIDAVVRGGESRRSASRRFGVSEASAIKWVQRYERVGDRRCAGTGGHRPSKVKPERDWLLAAIATEPDITLSALSAKLLVERGSVRTRACYRASSSAKVSASKKSVLPSEQDRRDVARRRASWKRSSEAVRRGLGQPPR
ncbi:IS630 transposase-related protein [Sphingobium sp. JS3065]|uniref:IS630 transposase-related protein n=1 Tax=Sphingobium sp. JS3065 TaxID=2970925 RepID=UPI0022648753|nr:IS630 transposase-related protein [Sphingobium sp. JS3065]UZW55476.1 IS630 transposase-related protein [Sphingobium sp. JS3065]